MEEIILLRPEDIDVKVKKVIDGKVLLLLYKTSRVDMAILDEVFGVENWCDDYKEVKGNLYCGIGVRTEKTEDFVWKWDCGIESKEDEGNQKKGEASDAFKRAGFKLGIGRELYTAPVIWVDAETVSDGKMFKLKDRYASYSVNEIEYSTNRAISKLVIVDKHGNQVYPKTMGNKQPAEPPKSPEKIICERCRKEIVGRSVNGSFRTPEQIKESCKGLCLECYKEETKLLPNNEVEVK